MTKAHARLAAKKAEQAAASEGLTLLRSNKRLTSLRLPCNSLGARGAAGLASLLGDPSCPPHLRLLDLTSCALGCDGAIAIAAALRCTRTLEHLFLSGNGIGQRGGLALGLSMSKTASLQACTIGSCALPVQALRGAPVERTSHRDAFAVEAGDLGLSKLGELDALLIGGMLPTNQTLKRLTLQANALCGVRDGWGAFVAFGMRSLVAGLSSNAALRALDLSYIAMCGVETYTSGAAGESLASPLRCLLPSPCAFIPCRQQGALRQLRAPPAGVHRGVARDSHDQHLPA